MEFEMIGDCGELGLEFENISGPGARITMDFLSELSENFVERCIKYYDKTMDHAFAYRERQLHSIICPSIADITDSFLIENPIIRKPAGEEEYRGAVDYWILHRKLSFLVELKHTFFAYTSAKNPRKIMVEKFSRALEQLRSVRTEECRNQTVGNGIRKIALEAVVFYRGSKDKNKLKYDLERQDFREMFEKLLINSGLKYKSNMRALWVLDKSYAEPIKVANSYEIYPAVAFIGKVLKIIE